MILHFLQFPDEATAKSALPDYWSQTDTGGDWKRSFIDGPIPIVDGSGNPVSGYFLNVALDSLNQSLPGLTGAGYGPADDFTLVYGVKPITPQRVFA